MNIRRFKTVACFVLVLAVVLFFAAGANAQSKHSFSIVTGGTGFRYELARKYGLHMGLDVAFGPDDPVVYVQFGSAWMRP